MQQTKYQFFKGIFLYKVDVTVPNCSNVLSILGSFRTSQKVSFFSEILSKTPFIKN